MTAYLALFAGSLLAATLLPFSSEAMLAALLLAQPEHAWALFAVATAGNTLGAVINWGIGRWATRWGGRRLERAAAWFQRWGWPALLFAWVPILGDPLTVVAGLLRVSLLPFVLLVGLGKAARYAAVAWGVMALRA